MLLGYRHLGMSAGQAASAGAAGLLAVPEATAGSQSVSWTTME